MAKTEHPKKGTVSVHSLVVKKLAQDKYRYFFSFQNTSDQPIEVVIRVRVYPRYFRLLCRWVSFRLALPAKGYGSGAIESQFLYKQARFQWKTDACYGMGEISAVREDLTLINSLFTR